LPGVRLRDVGEFGLIERIERLARGSPLPRSVVIGIGDDAAVLRPRPGEDVVLSTDAAVEGVHFRWDVQSPRVVGRRALVAALSDLAAMGARPLGFTCALAAPPSLVVRRVDGLASGLLQEAARHGCPLVGGNVTRARETSLTLAVVGAVPRGRALTRRGARPGDRVCVTGRLGAAALEVERARRGLARIRHVATPRLSAGRKLLSLRGIGACIDLSDGLEADLDHLLEPVGLGAEIDPARVPTPPRFAAACARLGLDPEALALAGGEDYELLFTLRPSAPPSAGLARRLGLPVSEIGRVTRRRSAAPRRGWRHF
jgi:thiamine-monophosphate kinase